MRLKRRIRIFRTALLIGVSALALIVGSISFDGDQVVGFGVDQAFARGGDSSGGGSGGSGGGGSGGSRGGGSSDAGSSDGGDHLDGGDQTDGQHEDGQGSPQYRGGADRGGEGGGTPGSGSSSGGGSTGSASGGASDSGGSGGSGGGGYTSTQQPAKPAPAVAEEPPDAGGPEVAGNRPTDTGNGPPAEPGGPPTDVGSGDLYGDLWVVLRDDDGLPIYVTVIGEQDQLVLAPQPVDINGDPIPLSLEGTPLLVLRDTETKELIVDPAFASDYTYTDADGNEVTIQVTYIEEDGTPVASAADAVADDDPDNPYTAVQEVDLGRTNIARAPLDSPSPEALAALENALEEALTKIQDADSTTFDEAGRIVVVNDGEEAAIDSPLENLALYKEILDGGTISGVTLPEGTTWLDLASSLLGAASDKEEPLDIDEIVYLNAFMEIAGTLTDDDGKTYYDYTEFEYDRTAYATVEVSWQEFVEYNDEGEPVFVVKTDSVLVAVFGGDDLVDDELVNIAAFTTAADDARAIIEFIHDNPVPTAPTS